VQEVAPGLFKWGQYEEQADSREEAWARIAERWAETQKHKLELLREQEESKVAVAAVLREDKALRRGVCHTLKWDMNSTESFEGTLWGEGRSWVFKDRAGATVEAEVPETVRWRDVDVQRDRLLFAKLRARRVAAAKQNRLSELRRMRCESMPQAAGDMTIKCTHASGKKVYVWQGTQVLATPREKRDPWEPSASARKDAFSRETTPDRALRKMRRKLKTLMDRSAQGAQVPIVVTRQVPFDSTTADGGEDGVAPVHAVPSDELLATESMPALRSLNDPHLLDHVRNAYVFLASARLLHCENCDEEWVVFDAEWPQAGVPFAGPKAGSCETIKRRGFEASWKYANRCSRCATASAYNIMYCRENLQHLGPRRSALSSLTWYESLLIARVHPVMSVITLTATGLLCYAGHVCNYYVKTLEWFQGLPAVLRDKKWFLIKRRKSIRAPPGEAQQKKTNDR